MSDSTNDAARWRKPEEELPEVGVRVEAWNILFTGATAYSPDTQWTLRGFGGNWYCCKDNRPVKRCLAWRYHPTPDKPSWIP